jgi:hypothetical protein
MRYICNVVLQGQLETFPDPLYENILLGGSHLVIVYQVEHVLYRYFPEMYLFMWGGILYSDKCRG